MRRIPTPHRVTRIGTLLKHVEKHYIEWIEVIAGDTIQRRYLKPGEAPEALFQIDADQVTAREYCNLHGHWKK